MSDDAPAEHIADELTPPDGTAERTPGGTADERTLADLRIAGLLVLALAVLGAGLGLVWSWWSGEQQRAFVVAPGQLYPFDEVETMAAADGRYLVIVTVVGVLAPIIVWWKRPANRGPVMLLGLVAGSLAGSALTAWVGHLTGGGSDSGKTRSIIAHLPLSLHMRGLILVAPALGTLVYGLLAAFAPRDDLEPGDPDDVEPGDLEREPQSVGAGNQTQDGWRYGDAAGPLQQSDLPAQ